MVNTSANFSVLVRIASKLPLEDPVDAPRPRIDYICFIIDMSRKESLNIVMKALRLIDVEYFMGRTCLVVHSLDDRRRNFSIELESIKEVAKMYNMVTVFGNIETKAYKVSHQILRMVEMSCGFKKDIQSIFLLALT